MKYFSLASFLVACLVIDIFQLLIVSTKCFLDTVQEGSLGLGNVHIW